MAQRCYLAPIQDTLSVSQIAQSLAETLEAETFEVFGLSTPTVTAWLEDPTAAAAALYAQGALEGQRVFNASVPVQLPGVNSFAAHCAASSNLRAGMLLVLDCQYYTLAQIEQMINHAVRSAKLAKAQVLGALGLNYNGEFSGVTQLFSVPVALCPESQPGVAELTELKGMVNGAALAPLTPSAYQELLAAQARADKRTIVLPESEDDRILHACAQLLKLDAAHLVLLGESAEVLARAGELGLDLEGVQIVSLNDEERIERYATELARLREKKGVTLEKAREMLKDSAYFGTMMIVLGEADGMVSGACHTTANTIRPALQLIKTKPGVSTVSGAFLMLFADHQHLYADCAVSINPNVDQLADIAVVSARTARQFGISPKVAMISYSTGTSGAGESVDKVRAATLKARELEPELLIEGPIQFDAAVDAAVAATKLPESEVAGQASVFVFNSLDVGNCTYKAVQRTSGAVAVGPILQGLNKPVNDLSRGALVEDIVSTVIITAVQAQA